MDKIVTASKANFSSIADLRYALSHEEEVFIYSRGHNPTVEKFNTLMAKLEDKEAAISFSSGAGAVAGVVLAFLKSGDHIIYNKHVYGWSKFLFTHHLKNWGIETTAVDEKDLFQIEKFIKPNTKMIFIESPSYYYFEDFNVDNIIDLCKKKKLISVLDNTYTGPNNLKGSYKDFDVILHSATKIICGNGEAMGGVACTSKELRSQIFRMGMMSLGAVLSPRNAAVLIEGLSTYEKRIEFIKKEMKEIYHYLLTHKKISKVYYPWNNENWESHPCFKFPVGTIGFTLNVQSDDETEKFCNLLKQIKLGVSYGSVEPLLMPAMTFKRPGYDYDYPVGFCRFSMGLSTAKELINEFEHVLSCL